MSKKQDYSEELNHLKKYLTEPQSESAKRHWVYPLFKKLFPEKFKIETEAQGADIYIEGKLIVELKSSESEWLTGFYQALHYQKKGLSFNAVCVMAENFLALWKVNEIPEFAVIMAHTSNPMLAPNVIGKENAKKTAKNQKDEILANTFFKRTPSEIEKAKKELRLSYDVFEFKNLLLALDADRIQINTTNFIECIEQLKRFFEKPIDAIHCFYTIVGYWDITSSIAETEFSDDIQLIGYKGKKFSEPISVIHKYRKEFKKFVESRYIFTNEGSGLTVDYYFSRFDEVLARLNSDYSKQHGIFFTDDRLSKFALWFVERMLDENLTENYIAFDPAAGSGNLVSSYRGKLKHKIVSELQPDLLRTIERRMKVDPYHIETGFTVIPKTSESKGLNFLDKSAPEYLEEVHKALKDRNLKLDKPLAFLLNPPYKNTDENEKSREDTDSNYEIHPDILALTGEDAGKERYLAFLGQILLLCKEQVRQYPHIQPLMMIFTPTSWLIPRPTYQGFREIFDAHFEYKIGFMVTSNEFFKLEGKWPVAFTVWQYREKVEESKRLQNHIKLHDFNYLTARDLMLYWEDNKEEVYKILNGFLKKTRVVQLDNNRGDIRTLLPKIQDKKGNLIQQPRFNMYRNKTKDEQNQSIVSGFPLKDKRHKEYNVPYGFVNGSFIGFMDNNTPVRLAQDTCLRMSNKPDRFWLMLMSAFSNVNLSQIHSGAANSRSFCVHDIASAKILLTWFSISKAVNGRYPLWANQYDIWQPNIKKKYEKYWYSLCYAFALAENRCVVTKFEANNPVKDAPEVFVDNPLCPTSAESFWTLVLDKEIVKEEIKPLSELDKNLSIKTNLAIDLVNSIKDLYRFWNMNYCKGQILKDVGLGEEPYFKYFDYQDFVTPYSGLVQLKKYAEANQANDLFPYFEQISLLSKQVKEELYSLLVNEFGYFD